MALPGPLGTAFQPVLTELEELGPPGWGAHRPDRRAPRSAGRDIKEGQAEGTLPALPLEGQRERRRGCGWLDLRLTHLSVTEKTGNSQEAPCPPGDHFPSSVSPAACSLSSRPGVRQRHGAAQGWGAATSRRAPHWPFPEFPAGVRPLCPAGAGADSAPSLEIILRHACL